MVGGLPAGRQGESLIYLKFSNIKRKHLGFTLIELLVVVAIIGLLSSIIAFSVSQARMKSRDARRISDMKQIKSGTDLYFSTDSGYPDAAVWTPGNMLTCNSVSIMRIPDDPSAPVYHYTYTPTTEANPASGCGTTVRKGYKI
ncbi:MAG: prepilin-type N-terminal cleavage/methylation domain-containing protein, partial [bacterium]|nr:prepilin-type N-terminal cleavage/methylation domain-containing protein [bacterium]